MGSYLRLFWASDVGESTVTKLMIYTENVE